MKKIRLNQLQSPDYTSNLVRNRKYRIFLGNGVIIYFSDAKEARAFLAETNRFLNFRLMDLNSIYIQIWSEWRRLYIIFYELIGNENFSILPANIDKTIHLMLSRSSWASGNHFTFKWFFVLIESLEDFAGGIHRVLVEKKRNYNTYEMAILLRRLAAIRAEIENFGRDRAGSAPPAPWDQKKFDSDNE